MEHSQLYFKITSLPNELKSEVLGFIDSLIMKSKKESEKQANEIRLCKR